jgi:hypothetical protein
MDNRLMPPSPGFAHVVVPERVHTGNALPRGEAESILVRTHEFANRYDWHEWSWSDEGGAWYAKANGRQITAEQLAAVTHWQRNPVRMHWLGR